MKVSLPSRYPFAETVPKDGASCDTCKYLGDDANSCKNKFYIKAHGGSDLGARAARWCCMAWTPEGGRK